MCRLKKEENIGNVEVYIVDDVCQVKEKVVEYIDGGLISVIYDVKIKDYADNLSRCFRGGNYHLIETCLVEEIPPHTRFIIGVGAGRVANEVRRKAEQLNIDCVLVFSAPTTDTVLQPHNGKEFKAVFLEENLINSCPKQCIGSGWGIVLSEQLRGFEDYYEEKIFQHSCNLYLNRPIDIADAMAALKQLTIKFHFVKIY